MKNGAFPTISSSKARPCFFVQNNLVDRLTIPVANFARASAIDLLDRSSNAGLVIDNCGIDWSQFSPVLPYGSVQFIRKIKSSMLNKFIWHDEQNFRTETWFRHFGELVLNHSGLVLPAKDVGYNLRNTMAHVRPDQEDKAFNAKVFTEQSWEQTRAERNLSPDLFCWISPVKAIHKEWRCWFIGGNLVEISQYLVNGVVAPANGAPCEVWNFAENISRTWLAEPCVVMDVTLHCGNLYVLEFNPIHCSGWYSADVNKILMSWVEWSKGYFKVVRNMT